MNELLYSDKEIDTISAFPMSILSEDSKVQFQSIFSVEEQKRIGREILIPKNNGKIILPNFTKSDEIFVLRIGFSDLIQDFNTSSGMESKLLNYLKTQGLQANQIYLQIDCQQSKEDTNQLLVALDFWKELGFRILVKGLGSDSPAVSFLGALKPDMIKVDLHEQVGIPDSEFHTILYFLKDFSLTTGAALLFDGIDSEKKLRLALESGALYLQGEALSPIQEADVSDEFQNGNLLDILNSYHDWKRKKIAKEIQTETKLLEQLNQSEIRLKQIGNLVYLDAQSLFKISNKIKRIYITDWTGTQISNLFERQGESSFIEKQQNVRKNWSYLPFFYRHVKKAFSNPEQWHLSEPYWDKDLKEQIVVHSKVIGSAYSLFLDISTERD
ncbi:cyclic diguanylate phosphodiesterase (EAL) domain / EAL-domain associated signaling protein domain multi-domain protein [Leptospira ryugenii]|uniref:Cyclic diguanylate phosphodiesterase (EAL) domain / EAL-domain associated signaling protein domain multi-domain protein n=1 Tax=Leptospira ryugenii TaxID=1917863 RepID=A0A2P2E455_9LEPT|nr:EAL domain-containing protein [Leptospira ryugenii]GBF51659.1 cyclic diguanylate phosphodiesterase (EAL) domain / EAL-domain associated signaling protein domain multi-domain protein [Leptospira ryugenii]